MIPIKLSLSGFLSYKEPAELDFRGFDLACIAGPNGAGKSSLLDALTWVLFGVARRKDDSLINTSSDTAAVELVFLYEGNVYRVQRSKKILKTAMLEFQIMQIEPGKIHPETGISLQEFVSGPWKPLTERTLRETQARIQETLRMDYDTFINASFFLQGRADQFAQQRPAERKRILGSILGLDIWELYRQRAAERRKTFEVEISGIDGHLSEIEAELAQEETRKQKLRALQAELERIKTEREALDEMVKNLRQIQAALDEQGRWVAELSRQHQAGEARLGTLEKRLYERTEERDGFKKILSKEERIQSDHAEWLRLKDELDNWDQVAERFREWEARRIEPQAEIQTERARLEQELKNLIESHAQVQKADSERAALEADLQKNRSSLEKLEGELERGNRLDADLQALQVEVAEARAENPRLKAEMDELHQRITQLKASESPDCPLCGQPLSEKEKSELIAELEKKGKEKGDRYRANKELLGDVERRLTDLQAEIGGISGLETELRKLGQIGAQISSRMESLAGVADDWLKKGKPRLLEVKSTLEYETFASEARSRLAQINIELKSIGYDAAAHDRIRQAEKDARSIQSDLLALERSKASLAPIEREISEMETQISSMRVEIDRMSREYQKAAEAYAVAQEQAPDLPTAEANLRDLRERENILRQEVGGARQAVLVLDDLRSRRSEFEAQRQQYAELVQQYRGLERAFGPQGVPALLIEQALPQIESKANSILERLGGDMSVSFITQEAYKDKKREDLRETLEIQIRDASGPRDYELFSGGEAFRINFAVRLALSEILAQRAGSRLQTLIIDEGFGSQDALGRQRLLEAINAVRPDFSKILVITHIDELKEAFPTRIEVQKTHLGSTVQVI
ncbi:MAG: AAA family ATPase [Anaerolineales bacterium]